MCCEHLVKVPLAVAAKPERVTWTSGYFDVSSTTTKRYSPDGNGPKWSMWIVCHTCHSEGFWGRRWADDLCATLAFVDLSF